MLGYHLGYYFYCNDFTYLKKVKSPAKKITSPMIIQHGCINDIIDREVPISPPPSPVSLDS